MGIGLVYVTQTQTLSRLFDQDGHQDSSSPSL